MEFALALSALLLIFVHLLSIVLSAMRMKRPQRENSLINTKPPVSLVVPLRGIENFTPLTISKVFDLDWPEYEVIFCVADAHDPVIKEVKAQISANPRVHAYLLIGDDKVSANPKLNNCVKGWRSAAYSWVILADSNVLMPRDYISRLLSAWRNDSGLVCSPPIGSRPADFWAEVECSFLNTFQGRYQYAAEMLGNGFAQGKTMLWNKPFLDARGSIEALGREIAEDAAATKIVRASGLHVHLVPQPFEQPLGHRTFAEIWSRQTRWARLRRVTFPQYFLPEIFVGALPPLLLMISALLMADVSTLAFCIVVFASLALIYLPELALAAIMGWPLSRRSLPTMMIRDLMMPLVWIKSFVGSSVSWRGNLMTVSAGERSLASSPAKIS